MRGSSNPAAQYEVVRSAEVFRKQRALLDEPHSNSSPKRTSGFNTPSSLALNNIIAVAEHYETKLQEAGVRSANQGLRTVAKEIEKDGLSYGEDVHGTDDPPWVYVSVIGSSGAKEPTTICTGNNRRM